MFGKVRGGNFVEIYTIWSKPNFEGYNIINQQL